MRTLTWLFAAALLSAGCASPRPALLRGLLPKSSQWVEGELARVASDRPEPLPEVVLRLDAIHRVVDSALPCLKTKGRLPAIIIESPENYEKLARQVGARKDLPAFSLRGEGLVVARASAVLPQLARRNHPTKNPKAAFAAAPICEAIVYQRIDRIAKARPSTLLDVGLAAYVVYRNLRAQGDERLGRRTLRSLLASEYLPIFLGAPRGRLAAALGAASLADYSQSSRSRTRTSWRRPGVVPFAAALYLSEAFPDQRLLFKILHGEPDLSSRLTALDSAYERFIRDRLVEELLSAIVDEEPVERRIANATLSLILGESAGAIDGEPNRREASVEALKQRLGKSAPPVRLLDGYRAQILALGRTRRQLKLLDKLLSELRHLLRRRRGFENDALMQARRDLPKAIESELRRLTPNRQHLNNR